MRKLRGCRAAGKPELWRMKLNNTGRCFSMFKYFKPVSGCTLRCFSSTQCPLSLSCKRTNRKDGVHEAAGLGEPPPSPALAPPARAPSRADDGVASVCQIQSLASVFAVNPDVVSPVSLGCFPALAQGLHGCPAGMPTMPARSRAPGSSLCPSAPTEAGGLEPRLRSGRFPSLGRGLLARQSNTPRLGTAHGGCRGQPPGMRRLSCRLGRGVPAGSVLEGASSGITPQRAAAHGSSRRPRHGHGRVPRSSRPRLASPRPPGRTHFHARLPPHISPRIPCEPHLAAAHVPVKVSSRLT